ncbi:C13 family peptidase [Undibacterium sp. Di27W]|uniref:C13 family peptidase n=1 Tax=Undibacterium sp. Di27W TaxID=3413036 RepID=UPI003BF2DCE2
MSESKITNTINEPEEAGRDHEQQLLATSPESKSSGQKAGWTHLFVAALRVSFLRQPYWEGIPVSPLTILILVAGYLLSAICFQWLLAPGPADFNFRAFGTDWFPFAAWAWLCFCLRHSPENHGAGKSSTAPSASHLFVLSMAQGLLLNIVLYWPLSLTMQLGWLKHNSLGLTMSWVLYLTPLAVTMAIQSVFLWRASGRRTSYIFLILVVMVGSSAMEVVTRPPSFWYPRHVQSGEDESAEKQREISQEVFEGQAALLNKKLADIQPHRPGIIDLYSLSFAPYGEENVFLNETSMVTQVMAKRFDAEGRSLQLANNPGTMDSLPWATPLNLQRAIQHIAKRMDVNEDILFLHMSSHGASDGELSAGMWPLSVKSVTPEDLKRWLDEAGIKYRVISISACYAGNWVAPLSDENSLVMTASDADHTSYGCGSKSDLTFFGRAMYDEQLRDKTLSFEVAHAAARPIIKQREEEAGKSDGYSNPQIAVGEHIRTRLKLLEQRLISAPAATAVK